METALNIEVNRGALDQEMFCMLYQTYQRDLHKNFLCLLSFQDSVEDILQEVFLKTWQLRDRIDTKQSLKAYMFRIGQNLIFDHYRRQKQERNFSLLYVDFHDSIEQIDEDLLFHEDHISKLEDIIGKLPPRRKQVFEMCKLERRSYEEVSELLDISPSTISDHIVKATQFIKMKWA